MADLLIRGMEMPKEGHLALNIYSDGRVACELDYNCAKAVELPDHGRLIDADALMDGWMNLREATKYGNKTAEQQAHSYSTMMMYEIADEVEEADTIIPASPADRSNAPDEGTPQIQIVADALKHGFYGTMYGEKYAQGVKLVFIEPGKAWVSNDVLFFRWGYPGPDVNTYKPEDYGKTWALTEAELTESIQPDPADKEGGA